jgi:hypothetical protein
MLGNPVWIKQPTTETFPAMALQPGEKRRVMFVHTERQLAGPRSWLVGRRDPSRCGWGRGAR